DYRAVELDDETLRDGLQGPSVRNPPLAVKKRLLQLMDQLGIDSADIGLPGASQRARAEIVELAKETTKLRKLRPNQAIRTQPVDVQGAVEVAVESGVKIESCAFIGSSPIRRFAENWSLDTMLRSVEESVTTLVKNGLPVMFVTEDTTRADPETLAKLYEVAIGCGAKRICASDTVGHATPEGVRNLLTFLRSDVIKGRDVRLDYHGHNDRGLESAAEGGSRSRGPRVQRRARVGARPRAAHRGGADERRVQRGVQARVTRLRGDARAHRARVRCGEGIRPSSDRRGAGAAGAGLGHPALTRPAAEQPDVDRETDEDDHEAETVDPTELVLRDRVRER